MPTCLFLSCSRSADEPFVWRLYQGLKAAGFEVWFDRLVLVVGPSATASWLPHRACYAQK